jgi:hypothetical protein
MDNIFKACSQDYYYTKKKRASDVGNKNLSCNIERNEEETKSSSSLAQQITNIIAL